MRTLVALIAASLAARGQDTEAVLHYASATATSAAVGAELVGPVDVRANLLANLAARALVPVRARVRDGRADAALTRPGGAAAALATRGFALVRNASACALGAADAIEPCYYAELVELARALTGADRVAVGSHVLRGADDDGGGGGGGEVRAPAYFVHGDFYSGMGAKLADSAADDDAGGAAGPRALVREQLGVAPAELRAGRLAVLNVWRPRGAAPVARDPLALLDASSLAPRELVAWRNPARRRAPAAAAAAGTVPENYRFPVPIVNTVVRAPGDDAEGDGGGGHRWYYFANMTRDEAVVFKTYDSDGAPPRNGVGVHASFELAGSAAAPPRESIEARVVCFWFARDGAAPPEL